MKLCILGLVVLFAAMLSIAGCSGSGHKRSGSVTGTGSTRPFTRAVPTEVAEQVATAVRKSEEEHPLSASEKERVNSAIGGLNPRSVSLSKEHLETIRTIGPSSIPVFTRSLESSDVKLREKAIVGLGVLSKPREFITDDYKPVESALIALYRRSLLDESASVRGYAVAGLSGIGQKRRPNIPDGVKAGLKFAAEEDPDPKIRRLAQGYREHLRLVDPTTNEM